MKIYILYLNTTRNVEVWKFFVAHHVKCIGQDLALLFFFVAIFQFFSCFAELGLLFWQHWDFYSDSAKSIY